ncbi:MAG: hypothetical protein NPIRA03_38140 [Nitrospirales bacterium]|nr:MAG: hypothetical protein NPIRA03_38140 [Nitrospirales bacterium]
MTLPTCDMVISVFPSLHDVCPLKNGGQKSVFLAKSQEHGKVVIKAIQPNKADARIEREIDIVSRNNFHNVPRILSHTRKVLDGYEWLFITEQYVDGDDLRTLLTRKGLMPYADVVVLLEDLLTTACELEGAGIVHRDIKPDNILCSNIGRYWLLDFGIARDMCQISLTETAARFGPHTAGYSAPEQFRNMKKKIDARTDLFSIGIVAYEAITGKHPFAEEATGYLDILKRTEAMHVNALSLPEDGSGEMSQFISVLMEKYPSRRPQTAKIAKNWFSEIVKKNGRTGDEA